jgi:16S rRNA A1518/A1519 N6-dimethyltransferase RsmA/KsgA/DIM1 with predicted DNA glycosylase/AP lyase activity
MTGKLPSRLQPWHNHVMKVKAQYPNKEFKEVLKIAKRTFHKQKKSLSRSLKKSLSGVEINTNSYNIKVKSRKGKKLSKKVTRKASRKASRKKSRRRKKRSFGFF